MRNILQQRLGGTSANGMQLSDIEHRESIQQWEALKLNESAIEEAKRKLELDAARVQLETERHLVVAEVERQKLQLDSERVANERAMIVVRALEVAVQGGLQGERLLSLIEEQFIDRLLPGPRNDAVEIPVDHQLENKTT
jgi:hypothetical protein